MTAISHNPARLRSARAVEATAHAKINLCLHILAREASGFHQLETLFLRLALADIVRVRRTSGARTLDVSGSADLTAIGPVEQNLAWRATDAYCSATGTSEGVAIEIEKRIPIGGGLGGGSADAAAVLRALDAMSTSPLGTRALMDIATSLGADVPFLTSDAAYALAWGRGERTLLLTPPPSRTVLLVMPPFGVSSAMAYTWLDEGGERKLVVRGRIAAALDSSSLSDWATIASLAENDFEAIVAFRHPEIEALITGLRGMGCEIVMMSGSGSTVFGIAADRSHAFQLGGSASGLALRHVVTHTATRVEPLSVIE